ARGPRGHRTGSGATREGVGRDGSAASRGQRPVEQRGLRLQGDRARGATGRAAPARARRKGAAAAPALGGAAPVSERAMVSHLSTKKGPSAADGPSAERGQPAAVDYLQTLRRFGEKPGLARIRFLLERLGNPHRAYPAVHVAGTNGKGS